MCRFAPTPKESKCQYVLGNKTKPVSFYARQRTHLESVALNQDTKELEDTRYSVVLQSVIVDRTLNYVDRNYNRPP